jgi:hypothetical protein
MRQLFVICIPFLLTSALSSEAKGVGPLHATLNAVSPTFRSRYDMRLRLTLDNSSPDCVALFVDSAFVPRPSTGRPALVVSLAVTDADGKRVTPVSALDEDRGAFGLQELILLECGTSYSRELPIARDPWSYSLRPGRYRARAEVRSPVGSFLRSHGLLPQLRKLWGFSQRMLDGIVRDASAESNEATFDVVE